MALRCEVQGNLELDSHEHALWGWLKTDRL